MKNYITMRPHHFLCLPGYKGYSYDKTHATSWDKVSQSIKKYPDMRIKIISGQDTLCKNCPNNEFNNNSCNQIWISALDEKVKNLLELKENYIYKYNELSSKIKKLLNEQKHEELCGDCHWRIYGLCKDTFKNK